MIELKPCPFCGGKAEFIQTGTRSLGGGPLHFAKDYRLQCTKCKCALNKTVMVRFDYDPQKGTTLDEIELQRLVDLWNGRADNA